MSTCTFFGHRDCPDHIRSALLEQICDLIENCGVDMFYVGNQGQFDTLVHSVLQQCETMHPHIRYGVVLAYHPQAQSVKYQADTMFPEELWNVHPKFALDRRNSWMLQRSDFVVTYIRHTWGGAYKYLQKAQKQGKITINLAVIPHDKKP